MLVGSGASLCSADETEQWDKSETQSSDPPGADWQKVLDEIPSLKPANHGESSAAPTASGRQIAARSMPYPAAVAAPGVPTPHGTLQPSPFQPKTDQSPSNKPSTAAGSGSTTPVNGAATAATSDGKSGPVLKGGVEYCVPSGTPFKLKLTTIPMPELRQEIRDEEGHLRPAQVGQIITAKTTEDIYIDDNKVIPEGTEFKGVVSTIVPPRRVGRPGHLELKFNSFTTPDGRTFAFKAEANNFKPSTTKSKLQGLGRIAAHGAGGAALGTLVAYQLFGMRGTIAMEGYNLAGGAALGCIGGIGWALWSRGPVAVLEPGDEFQMSIDTDLLVSGATKPTPKKPIANLPGLEFELTQAKPVKDGLGGWILRVDGYVTNRTRKKLNSINLFVEDELNHRFPVTPDLIDESETLFHVEQLSCQRIRCAFQIEFPKLKHKLIWLDGETGVKLFEQKL